jgi:uncharacterized membrane protein (UPF0127 family)
MESRYAKLALILILQVACAHAQQPPSIKKAQKLPSSEFKVCSAKLKLELATTPEQRAIGLMHRTGIEKGTGMVFVFSQPQLLDFWMRNVPFDIDIGYFDTQGRLVTSMTMAGTSPIVKDDALPRYSSQKAAQFAVETAAGFFTQQSLKNCRISPLPKIPKDS